MVLELWTLFSPISIKWLKYVAQQEHITIQHALTAGGEFRVRSMSGKGHYKFDGFCHATGTVYEFHGCLHHGCPSCFPYGSIADIDMSVDSHPRHPHTGQTMRELYTETVARERYIRDELGYSLVTKWECQFKR